MLPSAEQVALPVEREIVVRLASQTDPLTP